MLRSALGFTLLVLLAACAELPAAEQPDIITLKNGQRVEGHVTREDDFAVFIQLPTGEERGITKARIDKVQRFAAEPLPPKTPGRSEPPKPELADTAAPATPEADIFEQLKDLGNPSPAPRKAAEGRARELGFKAVPILLGMLNPKLKIEPELRIGALRALSEHAPLDQQGAFTLGFVAMKDKDNEVRREAARVIRITKEDRATEYLIKFALGEDKAVQWEAARALREVNNDRAFAALAAFIPGPSVEANQPIGSTQSAGRRMDLPVGPFGGKMPVYLPEGEISGMATNISSPASDALKLIAGKDLGGFPSTWAFWLREKTGLLTRDEIRDAYRSRSIRDKMGTPPSTLAP